MNYKKVALMLGTLALVISMVAPLGVPVAKATDPAEWYMWNKGVLTTDYYSLYPFEKKSVDFGVSKFGEMIAYDEDAGIGLGLQYPGYDAVNTWDQKEDTSRDPFANEYIPPKLWLNGWLMEIRYTHRTHGDRYILAMAMFADMTAYGGEWLVGHPLPLEVEPYGGRKINTYAETEDLKVLYDGPRRLVLLSVTHIYDWFDGNGNGEVDVPEEVWPVVDFYITFIFNKVKKQVIILKDVKQVIVGKELYSPLDIQLSNREEWDLGPKEQEHGSYAHFYHQVFDTCYGAEWHLAPGIMREYKYETSGVDPLQLPVSQAHSDGFGEPVVENSERVYVNGELKEKGVDKDYTINYDTGEIDFLIPIKSEDNIVVYYKLYKGELEGTTWKDGEGKGIWDHKFDVAQIISADMKYVGWKAFWPSLSDYTVDGWLKSLEPLVDVDEDDMGTEPDIPFVIGEWDFMLGKGYPKQFRGVEVVGVTEYHDADDADIGQGHTNKLDSEVLYQLMEIFNPKDLDYAIHKSTKRAVEFFTYSEDFTDDYVLLAHQPLYVDWDAYCSCAERVILIEDGKPTRVLIPKRVQPTEYDYTLDAANKKIIFTSNFLESIEEGDKVKVLYSYEETHDKAWIYEGEWDANDVFYLGNKPIEDGSEEVFIDGSKKDKGTDYEIDYDSGTIKMLKDSEYYGTGSHELKVTYKLLGGRYEFIVAGEPSHVVDSLGVGYAAAAIKNKNRETGLMGMDAYLGTAYENDPQLLVPYVMRYFGTSGLHDKYDYMDSSKRAALRDDWCTEWPISSANIISVGGPLVNLATYYFNDFTEAFYGHPSFTPYGPWNGAVCALTCWSKNAYYSNEDYGYAVIATYYDLNGTLGIVIWGVWGRDTYYAAKWFDEHIHDVLQHLKPHATSLILKIIYTADDDHPTADAEHPAFEIVEVLGTISETSCTMNPDHSEYKNFDSSWGVNVEGWTATDYGWPYQKVPHPDP
ncbi:hypothetical protein CW705_09830 [Candidatus Bathyarchaeota archaeon]|nr:MAG: hypothetical protein CW705_09830 [Candidatus Bathyarchaeota archaeon]